MELSSPPPPQPRPPSSSQPICESPSPVESIAEPMVEIPPSNARPNNQTTTEKSGRVVKKKKKKTTKMRVSKPSSSSAASSSTSFSSYMQQQHHHQQQRGFLRVPGIKLKTPKVLVNGRLPRLYSESDFDSLALPLGMSIAAFVAQVLDRNNVADERLSTNHLSLICSSAVKESLANVFGDRVDHFVKNFGESFGCTLKTLRVVNEASLNDGDPLGHSSIESTKSNASRSTAFDEQGHDQSSSILKSLSHQYVFLDGHADDPSSSKSSVRISSPTFSEICKSLYPVGEIQENVKLDDMNRELTLQGERNQQLACVAPRKSSSGSNGYMLSTFEKSVMEQTRSNDLKILEISLKMKELKLKESQLALSSDSNLLDRFKLSMGISKASFRTEKFQNQLEETRHAELLKKCIDCLVAGLFIMCASLLYGAYVYSYKRISEVTTSCVSPPEGSKSSWWVPKSVASVNSGWNMVKCQSVVVSRMFFGVFMILAVGYLLLQRSSTSNQTMPVTYILLLLGILCGIAGKLCVDTLGGSGYYWLMYWEALCMLHFLANICTSTFFMFLHGSVFTSQGVGTKARLPYWARRFVFYSLTLMFLPLLCGLMPFAGPGEWTDHFTSLATAALFESIPVVGS